MSQNWTNPTCDDLQTCHRQHHRSQDCRESGSKEEVGENDYPQVRLSFIYFFIIYYDFPRSKFKAGAENVKSSLQSISPQELLALLDSKDYIGSVVANDKYNGQVRRLYTGKYMIFFTFFLQVFSDEQLEKLLDRSDITWGLVDEKKEVKKESTTGVKGVFQVIEVEEKNPDLGSVKE